MLPAALLAACLGPGGQPAVCRSEALESSAAAMVHRHCPGSSANVILDWVNTYQINEGPYSSAAQLARDVLLAMRAVEQCR